MSEQEKTVEQRKVSSIISERLTEAVEDYLDENIDEILTCYSDGFTVAQVVADLLAGIKGWASAGTNLEALTFQVEDCAEEYLADADEF